MPITVLDSIARDDPFPPVSDALVDPDGLLAIGGNLSPALLLTAYRRGIFPWFSDGQPILWWSPDPRAVLYPRSLHVSRSLRKTLQRKVFRASIDRCFDRVVAACAESRPSQDGTWITPEMKEAYARLAAQGTAHSVEIWQDEKLVGGLYGVALGRVFFGESMFSLRSDASKVALVTLARVLIESGFRLIDCQLYSAHLESMGAELIPRPEFITLLDQWTGESPEMPLGSKQGDIAL